jgi:predicted regulator of Ras-like GTPase activity (Roadblock/LC7/MglB family)
VPLAGIVKGLPDDIKTCVASIPDGSVEFKVPLQLIQEGLPKGAVKVTFAELKHGSPAGTFTGSTEHDGQWVALPLKDIFARVKPDMLKPRSEQKTIDVPDDIKPVFGQTNKPAAAAAAPAAPVPAPSPAAAAATTPVPAPAPVVAPAPAPAAAAPVVSSVPSEIVKMAAGLPGASGALLSMQDGLSVAKQLPDGLNADMLAAFIPDIIHRVTTHTRDLKLGEVGGVSVQLGDRLLQVVKGGKLYLTTISRPGESVPHAHLASIGKQLAQLNK